MELVFMKEAYGMLYEIENLLRREIESIMLRTYGLGWMIKAPVVNKYKPIKKNNLNDFYLHELISLANSYECIKTPLRKPLKILPSLPSVRNKISHNKLITQEEFDLLKVVYLELKEVVEGDLTIS